MQLGSAFHYTHYTHCGQPGQVLMRDYELVTSLEEMRESRDMGSESVIRFSLSFSPGFPGVWKKRLDLTEITFKSDLI